MRRTLISLVLLVCLGGTVPAMANDADPLALARPVVVDKKDLIWRWNGETLAPVAAWRDRRGKWKGYFDEVMQVAIHGPTGRIAVIGRHKLLNDGKRTVFVIEPDGGLTVVVAYEVVVIEDDPKAKRFDAALIEHSQTARVIGVLKGKSKFRSAVHTVLNSFPFRNSDVPPITVHALRWNARGDGLLLIVEHEAFVLSIENGLVRFEELKPYARRNLPLQPKLMDISSDPLTFAPAAIRTKKAVHLVDLEGNLHDLWECNDRSVTAVDPVSGKQYDKLDCTDGPFQVFAGGAYFMLDHFILNARREPVMAVGPTRHGTDAQPPAVSVSFGHSTPATGGRPPTRFLHMQRTDIDGTGRHLATYTTKSRKVSIFDLSNGELRDEIEVDYGLVDHLEFSPDGLGLFLYVGKQGQGKRTYYAHHYRIDEEGHATRLQGASDVRDAYITDCCILASKKKRILLYEPEKEPRVIYSGGNRIKSVTVAKAR